MSEKRGGGKGRDRHGHMPRHRRRRVHKFMRHDFMPWLSQTVVQWKIIDGPCVTSWGESVAIT